MRKLITSLMLLTMSIVSIGCGIENKPIETNINNQPFIEDDGSEEKIHRVVASSVAVVEILDELGVDVVGVPTTQYELPERAKDATSIGNPMKPDMEIIKSLEPTAVISVTTLATDLKESFKKLDIPVLFANLSSYEGIKETVKQMGDMFEKQEAAEALIADFTAKEAAIQTRIVDKSEIDVLVMFGAPGNFMVGTEKSYVGDLVKIVGGNNIIEEAPTAFIPVDMEYLAATNPDVILALTHAEPETSRQMFEEEFGSNPIWKHFEAVKEDKVFYLPTGYFGMSGNLKAIDAMEMLVEMLYE